MHIHVMCDITYIVHGTVLDLGWVVKMTLYAHIECIRRLLPHLHYIGMYFSDAMEELISKRLIKMPMFCTSLKPHPPTESYREAKIVISTEVEQVSFSLLHMYGCCLGGGDHTLLLEGARCSNL